MFSEVVLLLDDDDCLFDIFSQRCSSRAEGNKTSNFVSKVIPLSFDDASIQAIRILFSGHVVFWY